MRKLYISPLLYKSLKVVLFLVFINLRLNAQSVTNYTFTASTGTFTALSSPVAATWLVNNTDDGSTDLIPIGFDFWYMGIHYTNVSASTNGWLALGVIQTDPGYINSLSANGTPRPVIAPLWDDLDIVANTNVTYKTTGTAGSRVFTVQYLNVKWNYASLFADVSSFQVQFHEGTGKIMFVYRSDLFPNNAPSASIGISAAGTGSGNFLSVNNAGTSVSSITEANVTTKPGTGKTYVFTPPVPTAPGSLTFSATGNTAMTLNWSDLSSNERGFVIYRSTDGINYSFVAQTAANIIASSQTGLLANTTYYWKVYALTEGALSTALSGSQATFCTPPAAPAVTSPVAYCQNATAIPLTATGTNLLWSAGVAAPTATASTPSTAMAGTTSYSVTQTTGGCVSLPATIIVNVTTPAISQVPKTNLISSYTFSGNPNDATGNNNGTLQNTPALTADRFGIANKAYIMNGSSQYISTTTAYVNPASFTVSIWFKTAVAGGKLIGFGREQTGASGQFDRHIYMNDAGQVYFGVYSAGVFTVNSVLSYNDNNWHLATATLSGTAGITLYIDGVTVGTNAAATTAENYTGYWRIGYDNTGGWTSSPTDFYFNGSLDDALIYDRALSAPEIAALYTSPDGAGNSGPVCAGSSISLSATTLSGATYAWTGPNAFTSAVQNPSFTYSVARAGVYTLQVTVAGCTATAYTNVTPTANAGQWTGNISIDWADGGNWCAGIVPIATTDVIIMASAPRMPYIVSSVMCNNLTINTGASLTTTVAGTLNIAGTLTNNGTITNSGTTNFNGTSGQQTFSGVTSFHNLTIGNAMGLLLPAAIIVNNNLSVIAGTLNANNFNISVKGNWTNNVSTTAFTGGTATVTFNGTTAQAIGGIAATTFNNLTIANATAAVTLSVNASIAGNLSISAGIFDLAAFTANRTNAGGILTVVNNAILKIGGTNTFPLNYTTNTLVVASTVEYSGTNQTIADQSYGNLTLSASTGAVVKTFPGTALSVVGNLNSIQGAGTSLSFTAASDITIGGNVTIGASTTFNGSSYLHNIGGNWINNGTFNGNTGTVTFAGAGAAVSGTGVQNFNNLTVAAPSVSFAAGSISLTGNLATTGAGSFSQASGGTLLMTGTGVTISGLGISPDNLTITGTVSTNSFLNLTGNLSVNGSFTAGAGTITMSGTSKTITGSGNKSFGVLSVTGVITTDAGFSISSGLAVTGGLLATAGTATFTGTATLSGTASLFNVNINGTSLQLATGVVLGIANMMTLTAGVLDVTSSAPNSVNFNGTGAQNINAITYNNLILSNGSSKTAMAGIIVNNSITIAAGTTFIPGTFTHAVYADWNNNGSFPAGGSTIQFLGNATTNITGNTTFNILTINGSTSVAEIVLQSKVSAAIVNMINGTLLTGSDTLTITNTRTGNGRMLGNIQRTHSFTTGVAYAFESPYNTITFSAVSSVTSIIVSISDDHIGDFPFGGSVNEEYTIAVPSGTYNATLRLDYELDELNGNNASSMTLWNYNGSSWVNIGKTANSTTSYYVEQSGLTNITNRWSLSDDANIVQWNGSVSTDWNITANWTASQGAPSRPPSASDIVDIGTASFINQPTINSSASAKNIHFGSAKAVTLTLAAGGSLTTSGNMDGEWSVNATHTINVNNQNLVVNGNLNLSDGLIGQAIHLNIGTGNVSISGSLIESGDANINFSSTGTLSITNDFTYISGVFSAGNGTVIYNGDENQDVANVDYHHLTINKAAGLAVINDTVTVAGNLLIMAGELDNLSTTSITGNVTISPGAILSNSHILHIGGNWINNGSYTAAGAGIFFDGNGTQTITASTFNNFVINKPVGTSAVLIDSIVINGNLTVTSGTLNIQAFNCNRSVQGGVATLGDSGTIIIGADNPPANFTSYDLAGSSTVIFDGAGAQTLFLPDVNFGNLTLRNAGIKTLASPVSVNGDLTIESGAVFDGSSNTLTLNGNWSNTGTFTPSTSTVLFIGAAKNISGNTTFNQATISGSYTILNDVTFNGLLNITSTGSLTGGGTIHTTLNGDLINSGVLYTLGTTTFTGNVLQTLSLINATTTVALTVNFNGSVSPVLNSTTAPQYGYLNINNTGGVNPSVGWTVLYSLAVGNGASFNGGAATHNIMGAVNNNGAITSNGTLRFVPAIAATVNLGSNFSSTGTVVFGGAGAMTLAGAPVSFRSVMISNTNSAGITLSSAWNITNNITVINGAILNVGNFLCSVGGNISNNGTINSGASTFTLNGTGQQDIYTVSPFNNLTINKTAGSAALSSNVTVNRILNFVAGNLQTNSNTLIQPASGAVTGAAQNTGWVYGQLQKNITTGATTQTFEVGDAASYTPVSIVFSNVTAAGDLTIFTTAGDHPGISSSTINAGESVNRFWTLVNNGIVFTDYNATFHFAATDPDAGVVTSMLIGGEFSGGSWTYPAVGTVTSTSVQVTGLTAFSDFQIGQLLIFAKSWDGGAGTNNWGDAANWNTDGVPTAANDVNLNGVYTINIDVAATTKSLSLNNDSLILTIEPGKSLAVSGDFILTAGTFNTAAAFPAVSGIIDVTNGTVGFTGSSAQIIPVHNYNNLISSSTGNRTLSGSDTIGIAGTFTPGSNSYTITGSTISFNGAGAQTIASFNYNNLILGNTGEKIFTGDTTGIAAVLSITGTVSANAVTHSSTISYNGTADQTITAMTYYNLDGMNTAGIVTLPGMTVNNDLSVSAGTISIGSNATPQTIAIGRNITIADGATFNVTTSSNATHLLTVSGDITNDGILNLRPDINSVCNTTFNNNGIQKIEGAGITTSFNNITTDLGVTNSNYVDVTAAGFSAPAGFLTLNNGSFNLNSTDVSITPFTADITTGNFLIPATAGLWVNAGVINSPDMNWTIAGLVKVTGGMLHMGNVADNVIIPKSTGYFVVTGGDMNLASRISNPGAVWTLDIKGGTITVNTQGSTAVGIAPFNMDAVSSMFNMSGGTIIVQHAGGSTGQHRGYNNLSTGGSGFTGGTLQMGDTATSTAQIMEVVSTNPIYNLAVNNVNVRLLQTTNLTVTNNVVVTAGTLDINGRTLRIGGSISNSGTFIADSGAIEMNGILAQRIPASAFEDNLVENLTVHNNAGVTLDSTLSLSGILLVSGGMLNSGGHLTLLSTATKTALVDGSGIGEVLGNVTMQRYLASGFGYKYFSSPFQAATVNEFSDDVDLGASFPAFYRYDESQAASGWIKYTTITYPLVPMQGYTANTGASFTAKTADITGVVNNHTISAAALYNNNQPYTLGFNLVGNPYPSPIDWNAGSGWSRTNIDNAVYYFNAGVADPYTGTYSAYINGVSSDGIAGNVIAAMQGFFVHVSNGVFPVAGALSINNNARLNNLVPDFHRDPAPTAPLLRLRAEFTDGVAVSDAAVIYFDQVATKGFDQEMDALKLINTDPLVPSLYAIASDTARLSICAWPVMQDSTDQIPLGLQIKQTGWITFNATDIERMPYGRHIYLYDAKTGIRQNLQDNPQYRVSLDAGEYNNRFFLVFGLNDLVSPPATNNGTFKAYSVNGKLYAQISGLPGERCDVVVTNMAGQVVMRKQLNGNGYHELGSQFSSGLFVVSFHAQQQLVSQKVFIGN